MDWIGIEKRQTQPPSNYACECQMRFYFSLFSHTFFLIKKLNYQEIEDKQCDVTNEIALWCIRNVWTCRNVLCVCV